jgi:hypothetical protein
MDFNSSLVIVLLIVGVIILVTVLVAVLYKTGKKLEVNASYPNASEQPPRTLRFQIVNIGRKRVKLIAPVVKFYNLQHSILYEVRKEYTECKFPRIMEVGDGMDCTFDLEHFQEVLKKQDFDPSHVRLIVRDTMDMQFKSNPLDYHL